MTASAGVLLLIAVINAGTLDEAKLPSGDRARALFEQAEVKFNLRDFDGAVADYEAAYKLDHRPAFLFNIGQCYRNLGDYETAVFFYRRFLTLDPRTPNRREAERLIAATSKLTNDQRSKAQGNDTTSRETVASSQAPARTQPPPFSPTLRRTEQLPGPEAGARPIYRRTWFWAGVGGVVAAAVTAGLLLSREDPRGSLPSIDVRGAGTPPP